MSKRIVIIPNFGESHLIKCQIPNLVKTINPDIVIYNEGLFPTGPESRTLINSEFKSNYCYEDTNLAWDTLETQELIKRAQQTYPNIQWIHNEMKFPDGMKASDAYTYAVSNWDDLNITVKRGDYIFPYEPDIFHLEYMGDGITGLLEQLEPNTGFTSIWLDFLETQNYIEMCNNPFIGHVKRRKIALRFGDIEFYRQVVSQFESQQYNMLYESDLVTYHYNWFRFDKNKQLRYDQIVRSDDYWNDFERGLQKIRYNSIQNINEDVLLRPSRDNITRMASHIDIEQPDSIKLHPNFIHKGNNE
jgi:hypothetical protein